MDFLDENETGPKILTSARTLLAKQLPNLELEYLQPVVKS